MLDKSMRSLSESREAKGAAYVVVSSDITRMAMKRL